VFGAFRPAAVSIIAFTALLPLAAHADACPYKATPTPTVTQNDTPATGNPHDYISYSPYYWPSEDNPGRFIYRDGHLNAQLVKQGDKGALLALATNLSGFTRAWENTGTPACATQATNLLHTWFIAPATRMTPTLAYAHAVPGKREGGTAGVIDGRAFIPILQTLTRLHQAGLLSKNDWQAHRRWFKAYHRWLTTNPQATAAAAMGNNHAVWYQAQRMAVAAFVNDADSIRQAAMALPVLAQTHIADDGTFPEEQSRTKGLSYSIFTLEAFTVLASLAQQHAKPEDWQPHQTLPRIQAAFDTLIPFMQRPETWPHQQTTRFKTTGLNRLLTTASALLNNPLYAEEAQAFKPSATDWLLYSRF
jgi:hypothetical protein